MEQEPVGIDIILHFLCNWNESWICLKHDKWYIENHFYLKITFRNYIHISHSILPEYNPLLVQSYSGHLPIRHFAQKLKRNNFCKHIPCTRAKRREIGSQNMKHLFNLAIIMHYCISHETEPGQYYNSSAILNPRQTQPIHSNSSCSTHRP